MVYFNLRDSAVPHDHSRSAFTKHLLCAGPRSWELKFPRVINKSCSPQQCSNLCCHETWLNLFLGQTTDGLDSPKAIHSNNTPTTGMAPAPRGLGFPGLSCHLTDLSQQLQGWGLVLWHPCYTDRNLRFEPTDLPWGLVSQLPSSDQKLNTKPQHKPRSRRPQLKWSSLWLTSSCLVARAAATKADPLGARLDHKVTQTHAGREEGDGSSPECGMQVQERVWNRAEESLIESLFTGLGGVGWGL